MKYIVILCLAFFSCTAQEVPTQFSEKALNDTFLTLDNTKITFASILEKHKGNTVVIDIWASWCKDCVKGMPKVNKLQEESPEAVFVFLSLDKKIGSWKKGIEKYDVKGDHYYMQSGWKGDFATFVDLDWIPRYLVVDKEGRIKLFKAIKADDIKIKESLK